LPTTVLLPFQAHPKRPGNCKLDTEKFSITLVPGCLNALLSTVKKNALLGCIISLLPCLGQQPVLMSEFGAEAKDGNHGPLNQRWTEEQQVYVPQHQFVRLRSISQLRGSIP